MTTPTILTNILKVDPARQRELIELLRHNTDSVIATLPGWRSTRLVASGDGASVIIHSEWDSPEAVAAMRQDARMQACFPQILALASNESFAGTVIHAQRST